MPLQGIPGARSRPTQGQASSPAPSAPSGGEQQDVDPASENVNLFEAAAAAANRGGSGGARSGGGQGGVGLTGGAGGTGGVGLAGLDFLRNNPQFQQLRQLVQESPDMLEPILQQVGLGNPQLAALISQNPDAFLSLLGEGADAPGFQVSVTPEEAAAIDRVRLVILMCRLHADDAVLYSCALLDSAGIWLFKLTSLATRTRS
jgi:UV excision repair protein RAD23